MSFTKSKECEMAIQSIDRAAADDAGLKQDSCWCATLGEMAPCQFCIGRDEDETAAQRVRDKCIGAFGYDITRIGAIK